MGSWGLWKAVGAGEGEGDAATFPPSCGVPRTRASRYQPRSASLRARSLLPPQPCSPHRHLRHPSFRRLFSLSFRSSRLHFLLDRLPFNVRLILVPLLWLPPPPLLHCGLAPHPSLVAPHCRTKPFVTSTMDPLTDPSYDSQAP